MTNKTKEIELISENPNPINLGYKKAINAEQIIDF